MTNYEEDDYESRIFFSQKVLELTSRAIAEYFTGTQILAVLRSEGIDNVEYPKTKWKILFDLFSEIQAGKIISKNSKAKIKIPYDDNKTICIIQEFLYPLNHNADEKKAEKLAKEIEKFIKYDDLVMVHLKGKYLITDDAGRESLFDQIAEEQGYDHDYEIQETMAYQIEQQKLKEKLKKQDLETIISKKDTVEEIYTLHQTYIGLLEVFCDRPTKPSEKLNDSYLYLKDTIKKKVLSLELKHLKLNLYTPFNGDLFSAEKEWRDDALKEKITWDKVRPNLNHFHSEVGKFYRYSKKDEEKTSDEKKLEEITSLISQQRSENVLPQKDTVKKMEILHKYEKETGKPKIKLSDYEISFDSETAQLKVGNFCVVDFPSHKNEHYLLRKVFSSKKDEAVDWQNIYEAINSTKSETLNKKEIEKQKKSVNDTVISINKRVSQICNTSNKLLLWETKCVKRLY